MLSRQGCQPQGTTASLGTGEGPAETARSCPSCAALSLFYENHESIKASEWQWGNLLFPSLHFFSFLPRYIPTNEPRLTLGTSAKKSTLSLRPSLAFGSPGESRHIKGAHALIARGDKAASTWLRHRNYCCTSNARFIYQFHSRKTHMTALFSCTLNLVTESSPPPVKCVMHRLG